MAGHITVSELNRMAAAQIAALPQMNNLLVEGEISTAKKYPSGHFYFSLKDEQSTVSCVMFRSDVNAAGPLPVIGDHVLCRGKASIYERDGRFQLYVRSFHALGIGELWKRFEALKKKLEAKGYFASARKKKIPYLPKTIGVVTSEAGAVIRDIVHVLRRRLPGFRLRLVPVKVQGTGAAEEIAAAIRLFNQINGADVLIVGRGGGSMEDLWCFNEEIVADAVFESKIPVISAVGHETDVSICDFVSDLRAPTPSAAAELAVPVKPDLLQHLSEMKSRAGRALWQNVQRNTKQVSELRERLSFSMKRSLESKARHLDQLLQRPVLQSPEAFSQQEAKRVFLLTERMNLAGNSHLKHEVSRIKGLHGTLQALSPWNVLQRGYAAITREDGSIVSSANKLKSDEVIHIRFSRDQAKARVIGHD